MQTGPQHLEEERLQARLQTVSLGLSLGAAGTRLLRSSLPPLPVRAIGSFS